MKVTFVVTMATVLLSSIVSFAKKSEVSQCLDGATSNNAMKQCVFAEYDRQDKKLNAEYQELMGKLKKDESDEGKEILNRVIKAERAWITLRDTSCAVEGIDMMNGSGEGLIIGGCLGKMTRERVVYVMGLQKSLGSSDPDQK